MRGRDICILAAIFVWALSFFVGGAFFIIISVRADAGAGVLGECGRGILY